MENPQFAQRLSWLSAVCRLDLAYLGTRADADTIRDTAVAQPLIVAHGLLAARTLFSTPADLPRRVDLAAGHSVGEVTVAAIVGLLSAEQAMVFVRERGRAMAEVAADGDSGMAAVLGGDAAEVLAAIEGNRLTVVNHNGPGQIVVSGTTRDIERLMVDPPPKSRVIQLEISGAFHTARLRPVADLLGRYAAAMSPGDPRVGLLSNRDGQVVRDGRAMLDRIVQQVSSPVQWSRCMESMRRMGATGMLEVPPAGSLTRIAGRAMPGVEVFALNTPDQLDAARAFVDKHATAPTEPLDLSAAPAAAGH